MSVAMLGLGALQLGGSLLSGLGAKQSSAKQARLQAMADATAHQNNMDQLTIVNAARERLGRELLGTPERHSERETLDRTSWVDVDAMMAAAERSGFNPVTWLNAGGMQAYTQTRDYRSLDRESKGHNAAEALRLMVPEYALSQASQVPQQHSMLSSLGAGLSAAGTAMGQQYRADMSFDLQSQRMAQMALGMANQGMGLSQSNGLATALSYGSRAENSVGGGLSGLPYPGSWKRGDVEVTNPFQSASVDSKLSDAETGETRYGDLLQELFGLRNAVGDMYKNVLGRSIADDAASAYRWTIGPALSYLHSGWKPSSRPEGEGYFPNSHPAYRSTGPIVFY